MRNHLIDSGRRRTGILPLRVNFPFHFDLNRVILFILHGCGQYKANSQLDTMMFWRHSKRYLTVSTDSLVMYEAYMQAVIISTARARLGFWRKRRTTFSFQLIGDDKRRRKMKIGSLIAGQSKKICVREGSPLHLGQSLPLSK